MAIMVRKLFKNAGSQYGMRLAAGKGGMNHLVQWVHTVEDEDVLGSLRGGEMVFTSGVQNQGGDWLLAFAKRLASAGVNAFAVCLGPRVPELPPALKAYCDSAECSRKPPKPKYSPAQSGRFLCNALDKIMGLCYTSQGLRLKDGAASPQGAYRSMEIERPNAITRNTIWKELLKYFFPILLGTFFQQLYNIVDASIVGYVVGKEGLAAVGGNSMTIINLFLGFFVGLGSGATVVVAQHYGAEDPEGTSRAVHTVVAISLAAGAFLTVSGTLLSRLMLVNLMHTPEDVVGPATMFLRVYFLGIESVLLFNIGSGILRAVGDSRRPLLYLIIGSVVNISLDLVLVVWLRLGVMGAALATLTAQTCAAALLVIRLMRVDDCYRLQLRKIRFDRAVMKDAFRIGLPSGFQSTMYGISNVLIQGGVNTFNTGTVAAWAAYSKIDSMFWMIINAFGITVTTFVSQNFGARKMDRVRRSVRTGYLMAMFASVALSMIVSAFAEPFLKIFSPDEEVVRIGAALIREITPLYFTYVSIEILSGSLRGMGESLVPMCMTVVGICVLRLAWLYFVFPHFGTMQSLVYGYPVTWAATSLMFIVYYLRGGWRKRGMLAAGIGGAV